MGGELSRLPLPQESDADDKEDADQDRWGHPPPA